MQHLVRRVWSTSCHLHVGDLAWQRYQHAGREAEWVTAVWEAAGEVVAWGWARPGDGCLELLVDPAWPALAQDVLGWFASVAAVPRLSVTVLDAETHLTAALLAGGYAAVEQPYSFCYLSRDVGDLPPPGTLPCGFVARPMSGEAELAQRVAVHRAAWHPSRVSEASYRQVMAAWPYRRALDWVVQAPDGRFAASCLIWFDEHSRVGLLEPVGTDPQFRRLGLARAVCLAALHALRRSGATMAVVYPVDGHPAYPGAVPLYRSLGFTPYARSVSYVKDLAGLLR